jgi:co-chaperonin GroES (HSP10)
MANSSGIIPLEFNVLIDPDKIEEKTAGGLYKPQDTAEREKHQQTKGTIVALSPLAFNADIYPTDMAKPQPGQRVAIALHAGAFIKGADGKEYRMVKDKDVTAMIEGV